MRVLYFTVVQIGNANNGGSIVCRSQIRLMANDPKIDLHVVTIGTEELTEHNRSYLDSLGIINNQIIIKGYNFTFFERHNYFLNNYPLTSEVSSRQCKNVDPEFLEIVRQKNPDIIVIDYLMSALYIPNALKTRIPRCVITLNREADFCRNDYIQNGANEHSIVFKLACLRWKKIEQNLFRKCQGIVALTGNDLPKRELKNTVTAVIPAILNPYERRWQYAGNKNVYYVGNILHYPNKEAVQWICTQLAPQVNKIDSSIEFRIIGAEADQVPPDWRVSSVKFLGIADQMAVEHEFTHNDLFIAPLLNNYGSKIKLLECVAYGIPFFATKEALSGLQFLENIPLIDLQNPSESARKLCELVEKKNLLEKLSEDINHQVEAFKSSQVGVWSKVFSDTIRVAAN